MFNDDSFRESVFKKFKSLTETSNSSNKTNNDSVILGLQLRRSVRHIISLCGIQLIKARQYCLSKINKLKTEKDRQQTFEH